MEWWDWCLLTCLLLVVLALALLAAGYLFLAWSYGFGPFDRELSTLGVLVV